VISYLATRREPSPLASCRDAREVCEQIYDWTGIKWLAEGSYFLLVKPLRIVFIVLLAVAARYVIHRLISRITEQAATARPGLALFRVRMPGAGNGVSERRRARMAALGSILRSIASAVVFAIAFMLILSEIGLNLAPILAGAGILGVAVGFGAQNLVRDFLSGLFMLFEDQYGVGDRVTIGETTGVVEAVGLRITTLRDAEGVVWYIRNGEILRVGNRSQGWSLVTIDVPAAFTDLDEAATVLRRAVAEFTQDDDLGRELVDQPEVLGVEDLTEDGAVVRVLVRANPEAHDRVARRLRRRLTEALDASGLRSEASPGPAVSGLRSEASPGPAVSGLRSEASPGPAVSGLRSEATREDAAETGPGPASGGERITQSPGPASGGERITQSPGPASGGERITQSPGPASGGERSTQSPGPASGGERITQSPGPASGGERITQSPGPASGGERITQSPGPARAEASSSNRASSSDGASASNRAPAARSAEQSEQAAARAEAAAAAAGTAAVVADSEQD
jgi:moderate conductance mechanosensitive channel